MEHDMIGTVLGLAVRTSKAGPMRELETATVLSDGIVGDAPAKSPHRGVTLIAARQWAGVRETLKADLPWHLRRANVLIDADRLGPLIGRTIRIGPVQLAVTGETKPCGLMDSLHTGLRAALEPDCRGGVTCRVEKTGEIRVGDAVWLL
jgi:MOSC domain-containing protein YiiM